MRPYRTLTSLNRSSHSPQRRRFVRRSRRFRNVGVSARFAARFAVGRDIGLRGCSFGIIRSAVLLRSPRVVCLRCSGRFKLCRCKTQQLADIVYAGDRGGLACGNISDGIVGIYPIVLRDLLIEYTQDDLCLALTAFLKESNVASHSVVTDKALSIAHVTDNVGEVSQNTVTHGIAVAARDLCQIVYPQRYAGIVLGKNTLREVVDMNAKAVTVRQTGLFVGVEHVVDNFLSTSEHHRTAAGAI